jgi:hypothetical protein
MLNELTVTQSHSIGQYLGTSSGVPYPVYQIKYVLAHSWLSAGQHYALYRGRRSAYVMYHLIDGNIAGPVVGYVIAVRAIQLAPVGGFHHQYLVVHLICALLQLLTEFSVGILNYFEITMLGAGLVDVADVVLHSDLRRNVPVTYMAKRV